MRVLGPVLGLFVAWILGDWFGWREGGFVALGAVMGGVAAHLHRRVSQLQGQLAQLQQQLAALGTGAAPATRAGTASSSASPASAANAGRAAGPAPAAAPESLAEAAVQKFAAVLAPPDTRPAPPFPLDEEDRMAPAHGRPEAVPAVALSLIHI